MSSTLHAFEQKEVTLAGGECLPAVRIAYRTRGTLNAESSNAVLLLHGYTGGPDMIDESSSVVDGSWGGLIGPGRAIDTDRYFVICPNVVGSCYGSTNAASPHPTDGQPWGSRFPTLGMSDLVQILRGFLRHLAVPQLAAVIGNSFGGALAFQWGVDQPDDMRALVIVHAAPAMPGVDVAKLEAELSAMPGWNGGDYYCGDSDFRPMLTARRLGALRAFGADAVLAAEWPDPVARDAEMTRLAAQWAEGFDANSLLILFKTMAGFDVSQRLGQMKAPLLYGLCRSDLLLPSNIAPSVLTGLQRAGVKVRYIDINSDHGHCAAGSDPTRWSPVLSDFLETYSGA